MTYSPEIWKKIDGYDGKYMVSSYGKAALRMSNGEYKGRKLNTGTAYTSFSVWNSGTKENHTCYVHTEVSLLFLGPRPIGHVICHLDGNKRNNRVDNLKYAFPVENVAHDVKNGTRRGSNNGRSKLDERDVKVIKKLLNENVSLSSIARSFEVSIPAINQIDKKRVWTHV